jgi:hypothetical protein
MSILFQNLVADEQISGYTFIENYIQSNTCTFLSILN